MLDNDNKFIAYDFSQQFDEMKYFPKPNNEFNPNFQPPKFPNSNFPQGNFPKSNFPQGNFPNYPFNTGNNSFNSNNINPSTLGAPPNYIPNKNDKSVKSFNSTGTSKTVSQNSIKFCLFQFTYIWERNGRAYWAFLLNVDRSSASGLRWFGSRWVFFGVDLRSIDSFICYRNNCSEDNCSENNLRSTSTDNIFKNTKKLYSNSMVRDSISKTLVSFHIPETKDDFIVKTIGTIDGINIQSSIPCVKYRNTQYSLNLEVTYPENLDKTIKDKIIKYANESSDETINILNDFRSNIDSLNPLENFDNCTRLISEALKSFSAEFNSKLRDPEISKDISRDVTYNISKCKFTDSWKSKF